MAEFQSASSDDTKKDGNNDENTSIEHIISLIMTDEPIKALKLASKLDPATLTPEIVAVDREFGGLRRSFNDLSNWVLYNDSSGIQTYYRADDEGCIRVEGILNRDLFSVLACFCEVDLYNRWLPGVTLSRPLINMSRFRRIAHIRSPLFWPLAAREGTILGYGDIDEDSKTMMLYIKSINVDDLPPSCPKPELQDGSVAIQLSGGFQVTPINPTTTGVKVILKFDAAVAVPKMVMNYIMINFCSYVIPFLGSHSKRFEEGGEYGTRIQENSDVYNEVRRRLGMPIV